jgi:hypothetical protein
MEVWEKKYIAVVQQLHKLEKKHKMCKQERFTRAILELKQLLGTTKLMLDSATRAYIQERLQIITNRKRSQQRHDLQ